MSSRSLADILGISAGALAEAEATATRAIVTTSSATNTTSPASIISTEASSPGYVGLKNCGNSCYMNATLQMLYHIPEFHDQILSIDDESRKKLGEPYITLYNIFKGLDTAAASRAKVFNPVGLLNELFECLFTIGEGDIYIANSYNKSKILPLVNKKFREKGIEKGYFTEENLKGSAEGLFSDEAARSRFLNEKLARNQEEILAENDASRREQEDILEKIKNIAKSELESNIQQYGRHFKERRQQDAHEFLTACIFQHLDKIPAINNLFRSFLIDKKTGFYDPSSLPADFQPTNTNIKDGGVNSQGFIKKFTVRRDPLEIIPIAISSEFGSLQDSINSYSNKEPFMEYRGLNINVQGRIVIPSKIEKEVLLSNPPRKEYFIFHLSRFTNNLEKISDPIRINKELSIKNVTISAEYIISSTSDTLELEGVICHTGTFGWGHYFYYWKDPAGNWIEFNDSTVSALRVTADPKYFRVPGVESSGYIFLYKKKQGGPTAIPASYRNYNLPISVTAPLDMAIVNILKNYSNAEILAQGVTEEQLAYIRTLYPLNTPPSRKAIPPLAEFEAEWAEFEEEEKANTNTVAKIVEEKKNANTNTVNSGFARNLQYKTDDEILSLGLSKGQLASIRKQFPQTTVAPVAKKLSFTTPFIPKREEPVAKKLSFTPYKNNERALNIAIKESMKTAPSVNKSMETAPSVNKSMKTAPSAFEILSEYLSDNIALSKVLEYNDDTLFEIAKVISPKSGYEGVHLLRPEILKKLRENDIQKGTNYLYQLTKIYGEAYFFNKHFKKPVATYTRANYQKNKNKYNKNGGRRRVTRKRKQSKV